MKLIQLLKEIKINQPNYLTDEEKYEIFNSLQGERKPWSLNDVYSININYISKEYFEELGWEFDEDIDPDYFMFNPQKIRTALKSLPVYELSDEEYNDLYSIPISEQYSLLKYNNEYWFVDSQGFSYPRYVTRILGL